MPVYVVMWLWKVQNNPQLEFWGTPVCDRMSTLGSMDVGMNRIVLIAGSIHSRRRGGKCAGIGRVLTENVNRVSRLYGPNLHRASGE